MTSDDLDGAVVALAAAVRVVALTGAGVSAESGVPTFRGTGGLWEGHRVEEIASPEAWRADPLVVWRFYETRRRKLATVSPNPGHLVLARWQERFEEFALVTQNVDGLHQAAGSRDVIELHGNIWRVRCTGCGAERMERRQLDEMPPRCPRCGAAERPAVVWFGECLPEEPFERATRAALDAELLLVVGTSAQVYPAAGLVEMTAVNGGTVIEVNPEPSALAHVASISLRGPSGEILPRLDERLGEAS
ncbi:MAG: NAD-dependent deacylase [Acidobacteriota bacterium]